ncbi:MAG TPA: 5'-3' exonuclease H3TH domain-containing protein, partial [Agriterribacter sp.]|nr:5'-3' exonuclease H3TH domain-containing protein [Agriterribacter sp.]
MTKRLFLLDAMALVFRAYYALIRNPRITSKGYNTNAQFGFTNTLVELINNQKPSHMAVCFDTHAPTERHTDFAAYKANRQEAPEDLIQALPDIKRIIEGFNIPVIELDGYEADDIIGTLSQQAAAAGYEVFMVTPDKDYGQLVSDKIKIYKPGYQGGDVEIMGPEEVCAKWNIKNISQVIDVLGLMGDAVDNIPGIAGVGEKTAARLLAEYETLEKILENAEGIKGALGEKIRKGKDDAIMSKKLATIITNVPVEFHEENFKLTEWNKDVLKEVFTKLEFRTIAQRLLGESINVPLRTADAKVGTVVQADLFGNAVEQKSAENLASADVAKPLGIAPGTVEEMIASGKNISNTPHRYRAVKGENELVDFVKLLSAQNEICFDTETTGLDANDTELVGMSFAWTAGEAYYIPCPADREKTITILKQLSPVFENENITWIGQNINFDMLVLKWYGIEIAGQLFDTMLAHYVIEPDGKRSMDLLSAQY